MFITFSVVSGLFPEAGLAGSGSEFNMVHGPSGVGGFKALGK